MGRARCDFAQSRPAENCSPPAWKKIRKCSGLIVEDARKRLSHHLQKSSPHYYSKQRAVEVVEELGWDIHDTDEDEVEPEEQRRSSCSRSPSRRRPSRTRSSSSNLLAIGPVTTRPTTGADDQRRRQMEYSRVIASIESSIRAARHVERLSQSVAVAFSNQAGELEIALAMLRSLPT